MQVQRTVAALENSAIAGNHALEVERRSYGIADGERTLGNRDVLGYFRIAGKHGDISGAGAPASLPVRGVRPFPGFAAAGPGADPTESKMHTGERQCENQILHNNLLLLDRPTGTPRRRPR